MTYNLRKALEEAERDSGETIEAIVVGQHDRARFDESPLADENVLLSREDGLAKLDQDYDNGYGGADCFPFLAWTKSYVYFVSEYDGATGLSAVPRHPLAVEPRFQ